MLDLAIRPLTASDVSRLIEIDAEFESDRLLDVDKTVDGSGVTWRLVERRLDPPFRSRYFGLNRQQRAEVSIRLEEGNGLYLVAEDTHTGRLVGLLDMEHEGWRDTAVVWNIMIDRAFRRKGLGRDLMHRAIAWAREQGLRGIVLETQTNNMPACCFYQSLGFKLCGIDDHFYSNDDIGAREVAIFWWRELETPPQTSDGSKAGGGG